MNASLSKRDQKPICLAGFGNIRAATVQRMGGAVHAIGHRLNAHSAMNTGNDTTITQKFVLT
jgi:hypothetical protein